MVNHKSNPSSTNASNFFYGYIIVAAAFLIMMVTIGNRYAFGVFFKPMIADFGWTRALTSGAFSLAWIMECIMSVVLGGINDKLGPKVVITICGLLCGIGYLLMSQVNDIFQFYLAYGICIGAGTSVVVPLSSTTARWFARRLTVMTGIVTAGLGIGALIWPPIIERLISIYEWRTTCIIIGGVTLVIPILAAQLLKRDPAQMRQEALGDNHTDEERLNTKKEDFSVKRAISTKQFWTLFIILFFYGYALMSFQAHLVPHITDLNITAETAASILSITGGSSVIGRIVLGNIGDKIGNKQASAICLTLMLLSSIWFMLTIDLWGFYLFVVVFGFAYGGVASQQAPLTAKLFGLTSLGMIFGLAAIGFSFGSAVGPYISGYIFDTTGSYQIAFLACVIVLIISIILAISLTPTRVKLAEKF